VVPYGLTTYTTLSGSFFTTNNTVVEVLSLLNYGQRETNEIRAELRKVHKLVHEISISTFITNEGQIYLHSTLNTEFDEEKDVVARIGDDWTKYVEKNFD
jgi:hypothetical protein